MTRRLQDKEKFRRVSAFLLLVAGVAVGVWLKSGRSSTSELPVTMEAGQSSPPHKGVAAQPIARSSEGGRVADQATFGGRIGVIKGFLSEKCPDSSGSVWLGDIVWADLDSNGQLHSCTPESQLCSCLVENGFSVPTSLLLEPGSWRCASVRRNGPSLCFTTEEHPGVVERTVFSITGYRFDSLLREQQP